MTNDETLRRAQQAREILDHPLVAEALTAMRRTIVELWEKSPIGEREQREMLYFQQCAIADFEAVFKGMIQDGQMADHRIRQARDEQDRASGKKR